MNTSLWIWIAVAAAVVLLIVIVALATGSSRRRRARRDAAAHEKAEALRAEATRGDHKLREQQAEADAAEARARQAQAEADERAADAERLAVQAERRDTMRATLQDERDAQLRDADALDPHVRTDRDGYRVDEQGQPITDHGTGHDLRDGRSRDGRTRAARAEESQMWVDEQGNIVENPRPVDPRDRQ